jgi:hypothetical protein
MGRETKCFQEDVYSTIIVSVSSVHKRFESAALLRRGHQCDRYIKL